MREHRLGYREVVRKYWDISKGEEINFVNVVKRWERIFLEEGAEGLMKERRGRACAASGTRKGRPPKLDPKIEEDLIAENQRLRMEIEYLKKLSALVLAEEQKSGKYHSYKGEIGKVADNILKRDFTAEKPFEKLTTDVTELKVCNDKVYLSPVLNLFNREIVSYSISLSPNLQQVRDMLTGLFAKLPDTARPIFHSDQGWQYQHAEYQRLLDEHNITQSMSRKGNCMDNGAMENFFGRLKVEMFYGEEFESVENFIQALDNYIYYYNNDRISLKSKGMSPVQYRTHSQAS